MWDFGEVAGGTLMQATRLVSCTPSPHAGMISSSLDSKPTGNFRCGGLSREKTFDIQSICLSSQAQQQASKVRVLSLAGVIGRPPLAFAMWLIVRHPALKTVNIFAWLPRLIIRTIHLFSFKDDLVPAWKVFLLNYWIRVPVHDVCICINSHWAAFSPLWHSAALAVWEDKGGRSNLKVMIVRV